MLVTSLRRQMYLVDAKGPVQDLLDLHGTSFVSMGATIRICRIYLARNIPVRKNLKKHKNDRVDNKS